MADVVRSIAALPGRKICLVVSDGFLLGRGTERPDAGHPARDRRRHALGHGGLHARQPGARRAATRAPRGPGGPAGPAGERRPQARSSSGRRSGRSPTTPAGSRSRHQRARAPGLHRMLADNEAYYLLAYEPTNTKRDGRFRRIEVRLPAAPGSACARARATSRRTTRSAERTRASARLLRPGSATAEARVALGAPLPAAGIPVRLAIDYVDLPPAGPQALVRAHVDVTGLPWRKAEGRRRADVELVGGDLRRERRARRAALRRHVALDLSPARRSGRGRAGCSTSSGSPSSRAATRCGSARSRREPRAARRRDAADRHPRPRGQEAHAEQRLPLLVLGPAGGAAHDTAGLGRELRDAQVAAPLQAGRGASTSSCTSTTSSRTRRARPTSSCRRRSAPATS